MFRIGQNSIKVLQKYKTKYNSNYLAMKISFISIRRILDEYGWNVYCSLICVIEKKCFFINGGGAFSQIIDAIRLMNSIVIQISPLFGIRLIFTILDKMFENHFI